MSTVTVHIVGVVGNIFSVILFIPGALAVWRNRDDPNSLRGASLAQQGFIVCNAITWGLYAWLTGAYWSAAPGLVNLPLAVFTAWFIVRARRCRGGSVSDETADTVSA